MKVEKYGTTLRVIKVTDHPDYDGLNPENAYINDISVLTIKNRIIFNEHFSPICLPSSFNRQYQHVKANVMGWGLVASKKFPDRLMIVNVSTLSNRECDDANWYNIDSK